MKNHPEIWLPFWGTDFGWFQRTRDKSVDCFRNPVFSGSTSSADFDLKGAGFGGADVLPLLISIENVLAFRLRPRLNAASFLW